MTEMPISPVEGLAYQWAVQVFGVERIHDLRLRSLRAVEEVIELAQAYNISKADMLRVVDQVYNKPPGKPMHELGSSVLTLSVMASVLGYSLTELLAAELVRVQAKPPEYYLARQADKVS